MMDRRGKKQLVVLMPTELGEQVETIVEQNDGMSEASFTREALRLELQKYEQEGYGDE
jgi:metal-responsive CopG/Arc/MetJ family transcriptional regulator